RDGCRAGGVLGRARDGRDGRGRTDVRNDDQLTGMRRDAEPSIKRVTPLNKILTPTIVPIIQTALDGHVLQINAASTAVTIASNSSHPPPPTRRSSNDSTNSITASIVRYAASASVSDARPTSGRAMR